MAAHIFSLTDGTTTLTFTRANGYFITNYPLSAPETGEDNTPQATVSETIDLAIVGATIAAMQANVQALERMLITMRRRQATGNGPRVFLQATLDGDTTTWRTELMAARLNPNADALRLWPNYTIEAQLYIERRGFWEDATLRQLPLTNGNGSNNTSGLKIYNCGDSTGTSPNKRDNYVQVASTDVAGDLPAPVRLELTNTIGSNVQFSALFAATNAFADPANFTHIQEAENIIVSGSASSLDTTQWSGGYNVSNSIVGAGSLLIQATLSAALLAKCAGQDFHVLARFANFPAGYMKAAVYDSAGAAAIRTGDEIAVSVASNLYDLGVLSLPPGGYSNAYGALRLVTQLRTTGSMTVQTDFWALFPATGFRKLQTIANVPNGATLVDDPIEDRGFVLSSGAELPYVVRRAGPVLVWPGLLQRVYFLWADGSGVHTITQTMTAKAFYRPRRVTIG